MWDQVTERDQGSVGQALDVRFGAHTAMGLAFVEQASNKIAAPCSDGHLAAASAPADGVVPPDDPPRQAGEAVSVGPWDATRATDRIEAHDRILHRRESICAALGWHRLDHWWSRKPPRMQLRHRKAFGNVT
jgi:hypothetical protein